MDSVGNLNTVDFLFHFTRTQSKGYNETQSIGCDTEPFQQPQHPAHQICWTITHFTFWLKKTGGFDIGEVPTLLIGKICALVTCKA